ncbi:MAG: oxygen-insensitive NAD(P)H nitroreductase [Brachymonas sp.]|jgi:nitroreductase/dihydropteridine reductase
MDLSRIAQTRHSCKAFEPHRELSAEQLQQLQELLRWAPSSINSQPWHFYLASSASGKTKIAQGMAGDAYAYNAKKIQDASLAVLFCAKTEITDAHLETVLAQETTDGRFADSQSHAKRLAACRFFTNWHRSMGDQAHWLAHQIYIPLGQLLLGAAAMGLDACPIEGFDPAVMDEVFDLPAQGLHSVVAAAVGWRSADDFNASLPKSRLAPKHLLTWL